MSTEISSNIPLAFKLLYFLLQKPLEPAVVFLLQVRTLPIVFRNKTPAVLRTAETGDFEIGGALLAGVHHHCVIVGNFYPPPMFLIAIMKI